MKRLPKRLAAIPALITVGALLAAAATPEDALPFHERKEVAGLAVVFGAEPEPALTEEMQQLVWRVSTLDSEEAYSDMTDATVSISFEGEPYGPFDVRGVRRTPGQYQTRHIFTAVGEYTSVLTFKKGEESKSHSVDFNFRIGNRADLEIPRRGGTR